jgi:hypothetical protein
MSTILEGTTNTIYLEPNEQGKRKVVVASLRNN